MPETQSRPPDPSVERARRALREHPGWYHTIELAEGVVTPGVVDLRSAAPKALPDGLSGRRALDVGTFDGFWAFEMERRGAEVVAVDNDRYDRNDWAPFRRDELEQKMRDDRFVPGAGFRRAAEARASSVRWVASNVYDLAPAAIGGPVDFAFSGAILLHLRDPVAALERIRASLVSGGELRIMEPFSSWLTLAALRRPAARMEILSTDFNWWRPNLAGLRAWLAAAGFERIERLRLLRPRATRPLRQNYALLSARAPA